MEAAVENNGQGSRAWRAARQHREERGSERVNVGTCIHVLLVDLLGAGIVWGAKKSRGLREGGSGDHADNRFCKAEIHKLRGHLSLTRIQEHNVSGLDITVHETRAVQGVQGAADLKRNRQGRRRIHLADPAQLFFNGHALHKFHRVKNLLDRLAEVKNAGDIWMVDGGGGPGFTKKSLLGNRVGKECALDDLQSHRTFQAVVESFVCDSHGPLTQDPQRAVRVPSDFEVVVGGCLLGHAWRTLVSEPDLVAFRGAGRVAGRLGTAGRGLSSSRTGHGTPRRIPPIDHLHRSDLRFLAVLGRGCRLRLRAAVRCRRASGNCRHLQLAQRRLPRHLPLAVQAGPGFNHHLREFRRQGGAADGNKAQLDR